MTLVVCMPQSSIPQQYSQEDSGRVRARELGMYYNDNDQNRRGKSQLNKAMLQNNQNSSPKVHRYENGTLKILYRPVLRGKRGKLLRYFIPVFEHYIIDQFRFVYLSNYRFW